MTKRKIHSAPMFQGHPCLNQTSIHSSLLAKVDCLNCLNRIRRENSNPKQAKRIGKRIFKVRYNTQPHFSAFVNQLAASLDSRGELSHD